MAGIKDTASTQHSAVSHTGKARPNAKTRRGKASRRKRTREAEPTPPSLMSVVTREGQTTIRQLQGRRFVRFGEFRGKRVAWVQFYTCASENHSIAIYFQDRTAFYLNITPLFTVKPEYYRLKPDEMETIKAWPEIKIER